MWWLDNKLIVEKYVAASTLHRKVEEHKEPIDKIVSRIIDITDLVWVFCRLTHRLMKRCKDFSLSLDSYVLNEDIESNDLYAFSQLALYWGMVLQYRPNSEQKYLGLIGDIDILDSLFIDEKDNNLFKDNNYDVYEVATQFLLSYDPFKDPLSSDLSVSIIIDDIYGPKDTENLIYAYYKGALTNQSQHDSSEFASYVQEMVHMQIQFCTLCTKFFCAFEKLVTNQCGQYFGRLDPEFLGNMSKLSNTELAKLSVLMLKCIISYKINEDHRFGSMTKMVDALLELELPD